MIPSGWGKANNEGGNPGRRLRPGHYSAARQANAAAGFMGVIPRGRGDGGAFPAAFSSLPPIPHSFVRPFIFLFLFLFLSLRPSLFLALCSFRPERFRPFGARPRPKRAKLRAGPPSRG